VKSVNLGSKDVSETGLVTGDAIYSLDIVVSAKGAMVEGAVLNDKDQPVVDADVVAIPEAARRKRRDLYKEGSTDQRGRFTIHGLNPGHYTVRRSKILEDDDHELDFLKSYEGHEKA